MFPMVHYLYVYERKKTIVKRTAAKVIKRPKIIGDIEEPKANRIIKRPKIIGHIEEHKANSVIKLPKVVEGNDELKGYINPITLNYGLRPTYLVTLCKIKKKDQEWQRKLKTFEEVSQKNREKDL